MGALPRSLRQATWHPVLSVHVHSTMHRCMLSAPGAALPYSCPCNSSHHLKTEEEEEARKVMVKGNLSLCLPPPFIQVLILRRLLRLKDSTDKSSEPSLSELSKVTSGAGSSQPGPGPGALSTGCPLFRRSSLKRSLRSKSWMTASFVPWISSSEAILAVLPAFFGNPLRDKSKRQ